MKANLSISTFQVRVQFCIINSASVECWWVKRCKCHNVLDFHWSVPYAKLYFAKATKRLFVDWYILFAKVNGHCWPYSMVSDRRMSRWWPRWGNFPKIPPNKFQNGLIAKQWNMALVSVKCPEESETLTIWFGGIEKIYMCEWWCIRSIDQFRNVRFYRTTTSRQM